MNVTEKNNKPCLRTETKIAIILILVFVFRLNNYITTLFYNFGIPTLRLQQLWFFILPGFYILFLDKRYKQLRFKCVWYFLLFYFTFYFMEHNLYGEYYIPGDQLDLYKKIATFNFTGMGFLLRWEGLYLTFIFLINLERKYFYFILRCTIVIILINASLIYLDILNFINIANIQIGYEGRLHSTFNLNVVSDQNVFGIYCLIYLNILKNKKIKIISSLFIIGFLSVLIFIGATRGALLLLLVGIAVYVAYKWNNINIGRKVIAILAMIIIFIFEIDFIQKLSQNIYVTQRIQDIHLDRFYGEGRVLQIYASWKNFLSSPWFGIGYKNAAAEMYTDITRSNFLYTQILSSGGLTLFFIHFLLVYKLFANNIKSLFKDKIVLSLFLYVIVLFIFRRPDAYLGVIAYIVYYLSTNSIIIKRNYKNN